MTILSKHVYDGVMHSADNINGWAFVLRYSSRDSDQREMK